MKLRSRSRLTGAMTPDEKAAVVVALDHDARQPQHSAEMGLRALRLLAADLEARRFDCTSLDSLLYRMKGELCLVSAAIRQLASVQQDLIDAIRLEFDDSKPALRTVHVDDLIQRVWKCYSGVVPGVELRARTSRFTFVSDERWVERILSNLINNAVWHSDGSKILVGARLSNGDLAFEVRDNGRGLGPDKVARIFEPIKTPALSPIGQSAARSGLGLYNVRLFAERLGGAVACNSEPGRGTTFRVVLPGPVRTLRRGNTIGTLSLHGAAPKDASVSAARNKLVAILDDDLVGATALQRTLETLGVDVYSDCDPIRWLSVVTDLKRAPDLILISFNRRGNDRLLQLDILNRKWGQEGAKIVLMIDDRESVGSLRMTRRMPVIRKPLTNGKVKSIVKLLSCSFGTRAVRGVVDEGHDS